MNGGGRLSGSPTYDRIESGGGVRRRKSGDGEDDEPLLAWLLVLGWILVLLVDSASAAGLAVVTAFTVFFFLDFAAFLLALDGPGILFRY